MDNCHSCMNGNTPQALSQTIWLTALLQQQAETRETMQDHLQSIQQERKS